MSGDSRRVALRRAETALEELAVAVDRGDESDGRVQDPGREAGQPVEGLLGWGVENGGVVQRRKPAWLGELPCEP